MINWMTCISALLLTYNISLKRKVLGQHPNGMKREDSQSLCHSSRFCRMEERLSTIDKPRWKEKLRIISKNPKYIRTKIQTSLYQRQHSASRLEYSQTWRLGQCDTVPHHVDKAMLTVARNSLKTMFQTWVWSGRERTKIRWECYAKTGREVTDGKRKSSILSHQVGATT